MFIRPDHVIPLSFGGRCVADVDMSKLRLMHFVRDEAVYELYDDDGYAKKIDVEAGITKVRVTADGQVTAEGPLKAEWTLL